MTRSALHVSWLPAALSDLLALNEVDEKLVDAAVAAVDDLAHHRQRGKLLGQRNVSGDLTGLCRLRFDAPDQRPQRYRLVYRAFPTEQPTEIRIVALGLRADHAIYRSAAARTVPAPSPPSED